MDKDHAFTLGKTLAVLAGVILVVSFLGNFGGEDYSVEVGDAGVSSEGGFFGNDVESLTGRVVEGAACGRGNVNCDAGLLCINEVCTVISSCVDSDGGLDPINGQGSLILTAGDFRNETFDSCSSSSVWIGNQWIQTVLEHRCNQLPSIGSVRGYGKLCGANEYCSIMNGVCESKKGQGENCANVRECADGLRCTNSNNCQPPLGEGTECFSSSDCQSNLYCSYNRNQRRYSCVQRKAEGVNCQAWDECAVGLVCFNSRCIQRANVGGSCRGDDDCSNSICINNICSNPPSGEGDSCGSLRDCRAGLFCITGADERRTCQRLDAIPEPHPECNNNGVVDVGENCGNCIQDAPCAQGQVCQDGVCVVALSPEGGACETSDQCQEGLSCVLNICQTSICTDSDRGRNPVGSRGTVTRDLSVSEDISKQDECRTTTQVNEFSCSPNPNSGWDTIPTNCPRNQECIQADGVCRPVGAARQPCRADGSCNRGLECRNNLCTAVGANRQPCRADGSCNRGLECRNNVCTAVGAFNQPCNNRRECNRNLQCVNNVCKGASGYKCRANADCVSNQCVGIRKKACK